MNFSVSCKEAVENMSFTLGAMAALKTSRSIFFEGDGPVYDGSAPAGFALATGTDSASENWAFFPSTPIDEDKLKRVRAFFEELNLPFVWPLFLDAGEGRRILEDAGMFARGELLVMARRLSSENHKTHQKTEKKFLDFEVNKDAEAWAETAWRAFDSPPAAPASFVNLARGLCNNKKFSLVLAKRDGIPAGTAMLALSDKTAGIYYFATLPSERKKGVGDAIMREITRLAAESGHSTVTLQATPSGAPFYASRGFQPLFRLPLHSFSDDVF